MCLFAVVCLASIIMPLHYAGRVWLLVQAGTTLFGMRTLPAAASCSDLDFWLSVVLCRLGQHLGRSTACMRPPQVTLTSSRSGKFESKFYHKVYAEEFGTVRTGLFDSFSLLRS